MTHIERIDEFLNTQELSKDIIVLDELKNYEIVKLSKKLANMSKKQGFPVSDVTIQMSFKPLYGNNVVISLNDISFEKVYGENAICINFTNGDVEKGLFYWDFFGNEWCSLDQVKNDSITNFVIVDAWDNESSKTFSKIADDGMCLVNTPQGSCFIMKKGEYDQWYRNEPNAVAYEIPKFYKNLDDVENDIEQGAIDPSEGMWGDTKLIKY